MSEKGKVKFYDEEKGFGFIEIPGQRDVHFGRDSFNGDPPQKGDLVEFDVINQTMGRHARNLRILKQTKEQKRLNLKIPFDTNSLLRTFKDIDNFNLQLNKFSNFEKEKGKDKFILFKSERGEVKYKIEANFRNDLFKEIFNVYSQTVKKLNFYIYEKELSTECKMVIGLGAPSVYETSMTLHHIYGFPYIPGQAVKGVVRSYIIQELFSSDESKALANKDFVEIFGNQKHKGKVFFFDAYPVEPPHIDIDVMNVHYPDYYNGRKPPADYQNPNPVYFLVVKNARFRFIIGSKDKDIVLFKIDSKSIFEWLKIALQDHGIGAKTGIGYGLMN